MKILIVRPYPSYLSVQGATYNIQELGLAKALTRKGYQCDLLFWTDQKEDDVTIPVGDFGFVTVFYRKGKTALKNTIFINCESLFEEYDVLQSGEYNWMQSWLLAGKYPQKTLIYHGPYYDAFNKRYNLVCKVFDCLFLKRYLRLKTKFITKSALAKQFLLEKGIDDSCVTVAGVGMDEQVLFSDVSQKENVLAQKIEQQAEGPKLLYIGRIEKRRNVPFIIDALKETLKLLPGACLYIIGSGDEEDVTATRNYIKQTGVESNVFWQEKMEQRYLSDIYRRTDFFLLPTRYEIFGMVILEAMYFENVVLTTYNGGSATLIRDGENGGILSADDPEKWANKIAEVWNDKIKMQTIQENAAKTIREHYLWDCLADRFVKQYETMSKNDSG